MRGLKDRRRSSWTRSPGRRSPCFPSMHSFRPGRRPPDRDGALAFLLFASWTCWKPGPIGWLERLPDGFGIMADDLLGGAVAAAMIAAGLSFRG